MNLHKIASSAINGINRFKSAIILVNSGYSQNEDYEQVPIYSEPIHVKADIQPVSQETLQHYEGLTLQNLPCEAWCNGHFNSIDRPRGKGGDLFKLGERTFLVINVIEWWDGWCHLLLVEQLND